jgi:prepilin-type N-terminal cleavage/methylation domain-containing protein
MILSKRSRALPRRAEAGFTMIELSVVIFLLALISLMVVPNLVDFSSYYLNSSARRLKGTISYLHAQAASKKMYLRLNFDIDNGKYWVSAINEDGEDTLVPFMLAKPVELPEGIGIADVHSLYDKKRTKGKTFIQFFPTGYTERAVIHLKYKDKKFYTLIVSPITGRTKIEENYVELSVAKSSSTPYY